MSNRMAQLLRGRRQSPSPARGGRQEDNRARVLYWPGTPVEPASERIGSALMITRLAGPGRCSHCDQLHPYRIVRKRGGHEPEAGLHDSADEVGTLIREWFDSLELGPATQVRAMSYDRKGDLSSDHGFMHLEQAISFLVAPFGVG